MKRHWIAGVAVSCLMAGVALGVASQRMAGIDTIRGKPAKEAGLAALTAAEQLAGDGSWERIAVGRVYYLSGDKTRGQAIFDAVTSGKQNGGDWQRIGEVYAAAGDTKQANESFGKCLLSIQKTTLAKPRSVLGISGPATATRVKNYLPRPFSGIRMRFGTTCAPRRPCLECRPDANESRRRVTRPS